MLNFYWLLEREAVADERSGSFDPDTLGYSSSGRGHWPLTEAGSLSGMLNSYWPSAHPGSLGRLSGALNSDWLSGGSFFSSFSGDFLGCGEARGAPGDALIMADAGVSLAFTGGFTKVHSGAARRRRRRIINPIHAAFVKGLGDRLQDFFLLWRFSRKCIV